MAVAPVLEGIGMGFSLLGGVAETAQRVRQARRERYMRTLDALQAQKSGKYEAWAARESGERFLREQSAELGEAGAAMASGSPLELAAKSAEALDRDVKAIEERTRTEVLRSLTAAGYDPKVLERMTDFGQDIGEFGRLYSAARRKYLSALRWFAAENPMGMGRGGAAR